MGAHQKFGVIILVTFLGWFSSAEEINRSAANRFSWENTWNGWICSIPAAGEMFPGFHWILGKIKSLFLRIESCCSTKQLPDECKHFARVFRELFPWVEMLCPHLQGFIYVDPSSGWGWEGATDRLQEIPAAAGAGGCRERGRSRAGHDCRDSWVPSRFFKQSCLHTLFPLQLCWKHSSDVSWKPAFPWLFQGSVKRNKGFGLFLTKWVSPSSWEHLGLGEVRSFIMEEVKPC